jgi:hypothetical protein
MTRTFEVTLKFNAPCYCTVIVEAEDPHEAVQLAQVPDVWQNEQWQPRTQPIDDILSAVHVSEILRSKVDW